VHVSPRCKPHTVHTPHTRGTSAKNSRLLSPEMHTTKWVNPVERGRAVLASCRRRLGGHFGGQPKPPQHTHRIPWGEEIVPQQYRRAILPRTVLGGPPAVFSQKQIYKPPRDVMCTYHPDASRTQCTHRTHEGHPPKTAGSYLQKCIPQSGLTRWSAAEPCWHHAGEGRVNTRITG